MKVGGEDGPDIVPPTSPVLACSHWATPVPAPFGFARLESVSAGNLRCFSVALFKRRRVERHLQHERIGLNRRGFRASGGRRHAVEIHDVANQRQIANRQGRRGLRAAFKQRRFGERPIPPRHGNDGGSPAVKHPRVVAR